MTENDPFATQRAPAPSISAELGEAGFGDLHEIGRGGFGVVYRCVQSALDRTVAIKVLTADLDEENLARFFREQQAMGRLTGHPNIVNVLQVGTTESGRPYIVMQYHSQDSLEARIRDHGPLSLQETLQLGVKMAGALATAHCRHILHRDVKPANILVTDYGEPALSDFGIARVPGGFETATGTVTGSPAFTAPEVLSGEPPTEASDIYSLGATLFCAITGHAAFERRNGEQVVAQFLRITTQPVPALRDQGIPDDVSTLVEQAMAADPHRRLPTAAEFGEAIRRVQLSHGFPADEMAVPGSRPGARGTSAMSGLSPQAAAVGKLPAELTSFVGRRQELAEVAEALADSRLVTLTGIGGVGKTRLAIRVATQTRDEFDDGVWLVELGELRDPSLIVDVVYAAFELRSRVAELSVETVVEFLSRRHALLVLDNCEHMVEAAAQLVERLLRGCPLLRVLSTSREPLGIGGERVLRVSPLAVTDVAASRRGPECDAVALFVARAADVVPGFALTADNRDAVIRICRALDGLALPLELAAARMRAMTPQQILERLTDRYKILTSGSRTAPTRQQTLRLSVDWSYDLCTPLEQRLWARLAVFAGSFELDSAEDVCAECINPEELLDAVSALVDKSILIREDAGAVVRYRMLETLRDYGLEKSRLFGGHNALRRRHRDCYEDLVIRAEAAWIGPRQLEWLARLEREQPNLREAMEFCLDEPGEDAAGLRIAAALFPFWLSRGLFSEGRRWLDRTLAVCPGQVSVDRAKAIYADMVLAGVQGGTPRGTALVGEGHDLAEQISDPTTCARITHAEGLLALYRGDVALACQRMEEAIAAIATGVELALEVWILQTLGLAYDLHGQTEQAIVCHDKVLHLTELHGESVHRSYSLWAMGIALWHKGDRTGAGGSLEHCLRLARVLKEPLTAALALEGLAWVCAENAPARSAVLMGAAESLGGRVGSSTVPFPNLMIHHEMCREQVRGALGRRSFEADLRRGNDLRFDAAIAYALGENLPGSPLRPDSMHLTARERQVAGLIAQGLTNKDIATRLGISHRTAQGHTTHILAKLGMTSRLEITAALLARINSGQRSPAGN
ncbi:protein kinase domain-containing protein [Rhodococcus koreensis]